MNLLRRKLIATAWILAGAAVVGELIAGTLAFLWPRTKERKNKLFIAGRAEDFKVGTIAYFRQERLYINRLDGGFLAMSAICTHLRCIVQWVGKDNLFECPCHAGVFNRVGEVVGGPPPRPLDLHGLSIVKGNLVVDLGKIIERKKFDPPKVVPA
jgi:cytochrome b6-f complex iron-sulfur subunit